VPEGIKLSPVTREAAAIVNSTWKFSSPDSLVYINDRIRTLPSLMMTTSDGRHVGHMIGHGAAGMGVLYVFPEFRRKAYAKVIITHLAHKFFQMGYEAYVCVECDNEGSLNLHTSVGFQLVPVKLAWVGQRSPKKSCSGGCNSNNNNATCEAGKCCI
jgi:GNAT superfamily N-acetyltransferase